MHARSLAALAFFVMTSVSASASAEPVVVDRDELLALIAKAQDARADADAQVGKLPPPIVTGKLKSALKATKSRIAELEAFARAAKAPDAPVPCACASCVGQPIGAADYATLTGKVRAAAFGADKLALIKAAAAASRTTVAQAAELLALLTFPKERLEGLTALAPCLLDLSAGTRPTLVDLFTFPADRAQAEALLSR